MSNPLFSIIVVSFNAGELIKTTIDSTLKQTYKNYEIIVKDAVSTDNTVSLIPKDDRIKTVIEKDFGIYSGMNRAIDFINGKYVIFMNCGDVFYDENVLQNVYENIKDKDVDVIYGNYYRDGVIRKQPSKLTDFYMYRTPLCHQTVFYNKNIFENLGRYDEKYKICADCDLNFKIYFNKCKFFYIDCPICTYLGGGASETQKGAKTCQKEFKELRKKYFSNKDRKKYDLKLFISLTPLRKWCASNKSPKFIRKAYLKMVNKINK